MMKDRLEYITNLRFPLILGVVMDHASLMMPQSVRGEDVSSDLFSVLLSLVKISVPVFFIMSGCLFFRGLETFDAGRYQNKILPRWRTLGIPYFLWTLIYGLYLVAMQVPHIIHGQDFGILNELCTWKIFWMYREGLPLHFFLWYIRDLILMCLCTPVLWFVLKKLRHIGMFIILGMFIFHNINPSISFPLSTFYFSLGAYLSICNIDVRRIALKLKWGHFLIIVVALFCISIDYLPLTRLSQATLATGILFASCFITDKYRCKVPSLLTDSVFFIYATHCIMIVMEFNKMMMKIIPDSSFSALLFLRWGIVGILTTVTCIVLYVILKKFFPKTMSILTGSR